MIKSIFDEDESEKKAEKAKDAASGLSIISTDDPVTSKKVPDESGGSKEQKEEETAGPEKEAPVLVDESIISINVDEDELEAQLAGIENEISLEKAPSYSKEEQSTQSVAHDPQPTETGVTVEEAAPPEDRIAVLTKDTVPESKIDTIRNSGLAYSAAFALFGSVVFMLILGWFVDLLLGIKPWGTIVGIVLGAIIGFLQFFRLTSQIINPKPSDFEKVSLLNRFDDMDAPVPDQSGPGEDAGVGTLPQETREQASGADSGDSESGIEDSGRDAEIEAADAKT